MAGLHFDITGDNSNFLRKLDEARNGVRATSKQIEESGMSIESMFGRLAKGAAGFGIAFSAKELISDIIRVRGEFQSMQTAMETMVGKDIAGPLMAQVKELAKISPLTMTDMVGAEKMMLSFNIQAEDTIKYLKALSDISMGESSKFNSLTLAFSQMSATGKLMGQDLNQMINAGFNPLQAISEKTGKSIAMLKDEMSKGAISAEMVQQAFLDATSAGGKFYNMSENASKTINGQISMMQDALDNVFNELGTKGEGVIMGSIQATTSLIQNYETIGKVLMSLIATYGSYRAAIIITSFVLKEQAAMNAILAASNGALSSSTVLQIHLSSKLEKAQKLLNATMLKNPYVLLGTLIGALVAKMVLFNDEQGKILSKTELLKKITDSYSSELAKEKSELSLLLSVAKNEKVSKEGRLDAIQKLNEISPKYLGNLNLENINTKLAADAVDQYTMSLEKNAKTKAIVAQMQEIEESKLKNAQRLTELAEKEANKNLFKKGVDWLNDAAYNMPVGAKGSSKPSVIANREEIVAIQENNKELDKKYQLLIDINSENERGNRSGIVIPKNIQLEAEKKNLEHLKQEHAKLVEQIKNKPIGVMVDPLEKLNIENYVSLIKESGDKINELSKETFVPSVSEEIKTVTSNISKLKQELEDLRSGETTAETGKTVQSAIEDKTKELKAAEDALATLTGKDESSGKKSAEEQKKRLEKQKAINDQLLDLRRQNQQSEINLMAEGREKRLAQIEFDYDSEIAVILAKEKEWKEAQGGKLIGDQTKEIHGSLTNAWVKKEKSSATVDRDQLEAEKQAMNEYLAVYGDYQEKRLSITKKYNALIAKATTEGEKLSFGKEMTSALSEIDIEANKTTSAINKLFGDMRDKTLKDLDAINEAGEEALKFLQNGQWDATTGAQFGISEETFNLWSKSPEKLKDVSDALIDNKKSADSLRPAFDRVSSGLKKVFSAGDDSKKLKEGLEEISQGMNDVMQAGQFLADTFAKLGDAFGNDTLTGIAEGLNVAMDAMDSAMQGAKAGAMFGPIGAAAGAAIGVVTSLATSIAKIHDAKNEKRIERLQDQIETLDRSYEMLGDAIDKAYSKDASQLIEQQNELLEQQKVLIQQQIREEDDKKKTDKDKIKDWQNQLEDIDKTLADNKEKAVDAIFGEDLKSAIDNFAQAYADAWASGEDRAKSMKDVAKNMIRSTIIEMIKSSAGLGETVKKIRSMIEGFLADDIIDDWEQGQLDAYIESETARLDAKYGWGDKYMKEDKEFDLGITSDSIADTITEGLADGKSGFKDFAGSFEDMMKTAVLNSLKTKYLEGPLKEFQKKFSDMSESGGQLTEAEIEELRGMYADIIDGAKVQFDGMKDIAGLDFSGTSDNSLKGTFAKASEESVGLLAGQTGAMRKVMEDIKNQMQPIREQMQFIYDLQKEGWQDVKAIRDLTVKIDKNTEQVASNTRMIHDVASKVADNTRRSADALDGGRIDVNIKGM